MSILVTGGAGYIGSHCVLSLLQAGYRDLVVYDNLCNSSAEALTRVSDLTDETINFVRGDIKDRQKLDDTIKQYNIDKIVHFAGLKAVGESVAKPLEYYDNNVSGTLALLLAAKDNNIKRFIFSSSSTVYGAQETLPIDEQAKTGEVSNPYGRSKLQIEEILKDLCASDPQFKVISLRYFNPIGAHESGRIGEAPGGVPNNLMPYLTQVAMGKLAQLTVFGDDYNTVDGTGVRDYIHVMDLADGHLQAVSKIDQFSGGFHAINLGTGRGYSVLEIIKAFEQATGQGIKYVVGARRPGDIAVCYASCEKAKAVLGWTAKRGLFQMCQDAWNWQQQNPDGYTDKEVNQPAKKC